MLAEYRGHLLRTMTTITYDYSYLMKTESQLFASWAFTYDGDDDETPYFFDGPITVTLNDADESGTPSGGILEPGLPGDGHPNEKEEAMDDNENNRWFTEKANYSSSEYITLGHLEKSHDHLIAP